MAEDKSWREEAHGERLLGAKGQEAKGIATEWPSSGDT